MITRFIAASVCVALCSCATTQSGADGMCRAIAEFANATDPSARSVRLTTDWGGIYTKSEDPDKLTMAAHGCEHDDFDPGRALCDYLLENTSIEFSATNYRRALACIGLRVSGRSPTDDYKLPPGAISRHVAGVRRGVLVKVELFHATETIPPTLKISVQRTDS